MWLNRLEEELGNLRVALGWYVARGLAGDREALECGLLTAGGLHLYCNLRGHFHEGLQWSTRLLVAPGTPAPTPGCAMALRSLGVLQMFVGDLNAAAAAGEEIVAISRTLGDPWELAMALLRPGNVCVLFPRPGVDDLTRARVSGGGAGTVRQRGRQSVGAFRLHTRL